MDNKFKSESRITRQDISNPFRNITLEKKRIKSNSINLKDNFFIEDLGDGYSKIVPLNKEKKY